MDMVSASDARTRFGELLDRVVAGEEILITRNGGPVARIVPAGRCAVQSGGDTVDALLRLRERIARRTKGRKGIAAVDIKAAVAEGRQ